MSKVVPKKEVKNDIKSSGKITLKETQETALLTLYVRAIESKRKNPIIFDAGAISAIEKLEYNFNRGIFKLMKKSTHKIAIRAASMDRYVLKYMREHPEGLVCYMGCGMDDRFSRLDNEKITWFDLDFGDSISLHKRLYSHKNDNERHFYIESSVTEVQWMNILNKHISKLPFLFIAEGLFMYIQEEGVKNVITTINQKYKGSKVIFDAFGKGIGKLVEKTAVKSMGAKLYWGINNPFDIEKWAKGIRIIKEDSFLLSYKEYKKLQKIVCLFYFCCCIPCGCCPTFVKRSHRFIILKCEGMNENEKKEKKNDVEKSDEIIFTDSEKEKEEIIINSNEELKEH